MTATTDVTALQVDRMYIAIFYDGPWSRLTNWLYKTNQVRWIPDTDYEVEYEPKVSKVRLKLADLADRQDTRWREKYASTNTRPHSRWKRG